jgi:hypothetical protein
MDDTTAASALAGFSAKLNSIAAPLLIASRIASNVSC